MTENAYETMREGLGHELLTVPCGAKRREHASILKNTLTIPFHAPYRKLPETAIDFTSKKYPVNLATSSFDCGILWGEGKWAPDRNSIAVVGSRKTSQENLQYAYNIAYMFARHNLPVISGLAYGIDTYAHWGAIRAGGRTVAVMATPLEKTYPAQNSELRKLIIRTGGLVVTEFDPGTVVARRNFVQRDTTLAAYSRMVVAVAASEVSGTKHTVDAAISLGRPVALAAPIVEKTTWGKQYAATLSNVHVFHNLTELANIVKGEIPIRGIESGDVFSIAVGHNRD